MSLRPTPNGLAGQLVGPLRPVLLAVAIVVLTAPSVAHAASQDRVVVDLVQTGETDSVMSLLQGSFGEGFDADVVALDRLVDVGDWPWVYGPSARLDPCSAEPTTATDITAALASAEEAITGLEYESAIKALDQLSSSLCGCTEPLPVEVAHRIPFLQGLIHFYEGDDVQARESFRRTGEIAGSIEWDTSYSPEPQQLFLLGIGDAVQGPASRLLFPLNGRPDQVIVDGHEVSPDVTEMNVRGERHVVQFGPRGGPLSGVLLTITTPRDVTLFSPDSFLGALTSAPDTDFGAHAFSTVAQAAPEKGYTEVMVLNDPKWNHCWWTSTSDPDWQKTSLKAGATLQRARRHRTAGGVLTGAGGALVAAGAVLAVSEFKEMGGMRPEMETHVSTYEFGIDEYQSRQRLAGIGIGLAAAGAAAVTIGIVLLHRGKTIQAETGVDPHLAFVATPQGAWLSIGGRF